MSNSFLPFVLAVVIVVAFALLIRKTSTGKHFDERQLRLRADGYRLGYFVTLGGMVIVMMALDTGLLKQIDPPLAIFLVMMTGIVTFAVFCIVKEAFFSLQGRGTYYIIVCLIVVISNSLSTFSRIRSGSMMENGVITFSNGNYAVNALSFLVILIAIALKKHSGKEEDE